jgi:selenide,water dikinase
VLSKLPKFENDKLIVGLETSDDACVYKINDDLAMIQTVDFFTPVVDDPYIFGQIAAANSLSDIYAMGGEPVIALNIIAFPNCLSPDIMAEILKGGASKVMEAGATIAGGHSVEDDEPKYGMCVTGFAEPKKILKNYGSQPGDVLILTKPIGTGVINTAYKAGMCSPESEKAAVHVMSTLNKNAKRVIENFPVSACTDITGFGLAGHSVEMAEASNVTFEIDIKKVPYIHDVFEYAEMGLVPAGSYKNRKFFKDRVCMDGIEEKYLDLAFDPQTSGGLLFSVNADYADEILMKLKNCIDTDFALIGRVVEKQDKYIVMKNPL